MSFRLIEHIPFYHRMLVFPKQLNNLTLLQEQWTKLKDIRKKKQTLEMNVF